MDYIALPKIEVRTTYYTVYEPQEMPFRKPTGIYPEVQNFPLPFLLFFVGCWLTIILLSSSSTLI